MNSSELILTCPNGTQLTKLPFSSGAEQWLGSFTSFLAQGENNTRGPFITIPTNICWMSQLTTLNLTYNQLGGTFNDSNSLTCSIPWKTVDLSHNYLTIFPSLLFALNQFDSVYLNDNQLTTIDLSIITLVHQTVDLRNNQITSTVNPTNFTIPINASTGDTAILLNANTTFNLNDGIYEMYGACEELADGLASNGVRLPLTLGLGNIDFGTIRVNCSCDQFYIIQMLNNAFGTPVSGSISNLLCSNAPMNFVNYYCSLGYSTFNSSSTQPRLCRFDGWNMTTTITTTLATATFTITPTVTITSTSSTTSTTTISTGTTTSTSSTSTTTTTTSLSTTSTTTTTTTITTTSTTTTTTTATTTSTTTTTTTATTTSTTTTTTTATTTSTTTTTTTATTTSTTTTTTTATTTSTTTSTTTATTTSTTTTSTTTTTITSTTTTTTTTTSTTTTTTTATSTSTSSTSSTTTTSTETTTSTSSTSSTSTTSTDTTTSTTSTSSTTTTSTDTTTSTTSTSSTTTTSTDTTTSTTSTSSTTTTSTDTTTSTTSTSSTTTTSTDTTTSTTSTSSTTTTSTDTTTSTTSTSSTTTTSTDTTTSTTSTSSTTTTSTDTTTTTSSTTSTTTTSTDTTTSTTSTSSTTTTSTDTTTTTSSTSSTTTTSTDTTTSTTSTSSTTTTSTDTTTSTTSTSSTTTTSTDTTTSTTSTSSTTTTSTDTTTTTSSTTSTTTTSTDTTTSTTSTSSTTTTSTDTTTSSTSTLSTTTFTTSATSITTTSTSSTATSSTVVLTSTLPALNASTCLATFSISNTDLLLTCPSNTNISLLPINNYSVATLSQITSLSITGYNGLRGPLQTIPPNICFLTNLQVLNISYNRLDHLDTSFFSANPSCLQTLWTLDMNNNYFNEIPSLFLTKTTKLRRLFLQNNQIRSLDLALLVLVSTSVDLSNNQISKITNNANVDISNYTYSLEPSIDLTNNSRIIDVNDAIYEMYGACYEIYQISNSSIPARPPLLTIGFLNIDFDVSTITCNCNQYYIQKSFIYSIGNTVSSIYPLSNAFCTDGNLFYQNNKTAACSTSSVNFTNITPRLCQLTANDGSINFVNTTNNITGVYPYYLTQTVNNSYCLFTFYPDGKHVSIDCLNGSNPLTEISSSILSNIYFRNITQVTINSQSSFSRLPAYLCSLPSTSIDLSNQSFVILDQNTFPCVTGSTLRTINLAYNQIYTVNLTLSNWIFLDLTSNNLTIFPYTLVSTNTLTSRALSQRTLLLQSNQITQFDLFIYTYANTNINLQNNPFSTTTNGYHILNNYQKQSLRSEPVSTSVILPNQMRFLLNDPIAQNYNTCDTQSLNYLLDIFQRMKTDGITVEIQCDCSTIFIKEYYGLINPTGSITNLFSCSSQSSLSAAQFQSLTETNCTSNIALSSNRLCQFVKIESTTLASSPASNDSGRSLAIILSSVLGSVGFLLLLALLVVGICYKRQSSKESTQVSTLSRAPYTQNTRPVVQRPYFLTESAPRQLDTTPSRFSDFANSIDLSQEDSVDRQKRRQQRRRKEPPIDYDTDPHFLRIANPTRKSSHV